MPVHQKALTGLLLVGLGCAAEAPLVTDPGPRVDTARVELRIGSANGAEDSFAPITAIAVSPDQDRVFVLENSLRSVRIFDQTGRPLGSVGGDGGGPGEFGNPMLLGILADTLWVGDVNTHRYTFFNMDGQYLGDFRPTVLAHQHRGDYPARPSTLLGDGTLVGRTRTPSLDIVEGRLQKVPILRLDRAGQVLDTLGWRSVEDDVLLVRPPDSDDRRGGVFGTQPFRPSSPLLVSRIEPVVFKVLPDAEGRAELIASTFQGDERFRVTVGLDLIPLSEERVDAMVDRYADLLGQAGSLSHVSRADLRSWIRAGLYVPTHLDPVSDIRESSNGDIWLLAAQRSESDPARWRVFSRDGELLRDVLVPTGIGVLAVAGDELWGVQRDDLDIPYVVKLSTRRGR